MQGGQACTLILEPADCPPCELPGARPTNASQAMAQCGTCVADSRCRWCSTQNPVNAFCTTTAMTSGNCQAGTVVSTQPACTPAAPAEAGPPPTVLCSNAAQANQATAITATVGALRDVNSFTGGTPPDGQYVLTASRTASVEGGSPDVGPFQITLILRSASGYRTYERIVTKGGATTKEVGTVAFATPFSAGFTTTPSCANGPVVLLLDRYDATSTSLVIRWAIAPPDSQAFIYQEMYSKAGDASAEGRRAWAQARLDLISKKN